MVHLEDRVATLLGRWVAAVARHPRPVAWACTVFTLACLVFAAFGLRINSDAVSLLSEELTARQSYEAYIEDFPDYESTLLVVVDAETPELARASARRLAQAMRERKDHFERVDVPGIDDFFEHAGLLYLDVDTLDAFADRLARIQPLLASIERDPSLANLADLIEQGLDRLEEGEEDGSLDPGEWVPLLDLYAEAVHSIAADETAHVSWERLTLAGTALDVRERWILVVDPVLDFSSVFAALGPMAEIDALAVELGLTPEAGVRVRTTGNPALNAEEMLGIMWDIGMGGVFCFLVVVGVIRLALGSLRLVAAAAISLLCGLVWTTAFAAAEVGAVGLVSVAFAILFTGLAVDFTIHLGMVFAEARREAASSAEAIEKAARECGSALVLCTITTSIGFYVFVPTRSVGVAELGLIAGTGMWLNLIGTFTFFPALVCGWLDGPREGLGDRPLRFRARRFEGLLARPGAVLLIAAGLLSMGAYVASDVGWQRNVLPLRDPEAQSAQAFDDLLAGPRDESPWAVNVVAKDLAHADALAERLAGLGVVSNAITLTDLIPAAQAEKREILDEILWMLEPPAQADPEPALAGTAEQIEAMAALRDALDRHARARGLSGPLEAAIVRVARALDGLLSRLESDPSWGGAAVERLDAVLLDGLVAQVVRLRRLASSGQVSRADLPKATVREMIAADGRARIRVFPEADLGDEVELERFTGEILAMVPDATGIPINMMAFAGATKDAFVFGLSAAIVLITAFLFLLWRRPAPVLLALAPLVLSSVLTVAAMVLAGLSFNFVNIIVIPLLLGVGIDSGIHLVHRAETLSERGGPVHAGVLLETTTARAVFYSALTTLVSFGTLSLTSHRGLSSLGVVLSIGMICTVVCNLIVLPALLEHFPLTAKGRDRGA